MSTGEGLVTGGPLHVVCFKWGDLYSAGDVNKLSAMYHRHLSTPIVFHCVTDDPAGLRDDVRTHVLHDVPGAVRDVGNARKLEVFSPDFLGLRGQLVVLTDIDMVVVGCLDFLLERPDVDFLIVRGRNQYAGTRGHSALLRLRIGTRPWVWASLILDVESAVRVAQHHRGAPGHISDQRWLDAQLELMEYFPEGKVVYFRQDCGALGTFVPGRLGRRLGLSTAWFGVAQLPPGAAVVSFAGRAHPARVERRHWRDFRRAPFVARHWRE